MSKFCVYCGKSDDFNGEHVFSAGLGGDDKNYMLTDCVCRTCNTFFSKLEVELIRKSPASLARLGMQEVGRGNGNRAEPPKLQAADTYIWDDELTVALEAELRPRFGAVILPQFLINLPAIHVAADDNESLYEFIEKFRALFTAQEILTVEKTTDKGEALFEVSTITKNGNEFSVASIDVAAKPPKNAIWLVTPEESSGVFKGDNGQALLPRFYLHGGKTINYKPKNTSLMLRHLEMVLQFLEQNITLEQYEEKAITQPLVKVGIAFNMGMSERALAKIGFNFLIKTMGADYARDEAFDSIKSSILNGTPELPLSKVPSDELRLLLGEPPQNHHALALYAIKNAAGRAIIVVLIKLYGGEVSCFFLSYDAPTPDWDLPIYYLIDYQQHKISRVDPMEYLRAYCPDLMKLQPLVLNS
jgi:hypothetical protein